MTLVHDPRTTKVSQMPAIATNKRNRNHGASHSAQQRNQPRHLTPIRAPSEISRALARHERTRLKLPFQSAQGRRQINLTAHGYFDFTAIVQSGRRLRRSMIGTAAGFDRAPSRRAYRAHKDGIAPIACASATPGRHSRSRSPLRKSKSKPRQPTFGMFHVCRNAPPALISSFRRVDFKIGSAETFVRRR